MWPAWQIQPIRESRLTNESRLHPNCTRKCLALPAHNHAKSLKRMVGVPGIEPGTSSMSTRRSPAELYARLSKSGLEAAPPLPPCNSPGPQPAWRGASGPPAAGIPERSLPAEPPESRRSSTIPRLFQASAHQPKRLFSGALAGRARSRGWNPPLPPDGAGERAWRECARPAESDPDSSGLRRQNQ